MQLADLEVAVILVVPVAVPIGICVLVVWLNGKQQALEQATVRAAVEQAYGPNTQITSIRAGRSDVSLVYAHGVGGRNYRVNIQSASGPITELWKIDRGRCEKVG